MALALLLSRNLLLTVVVEGAVITLLFRRWNALFYSVLANVMTNPALNVLVLALCGPLRLPYVPVVAVLELTAVAAETWAYRELFPLPWLKAAGLSLLLNALSFGVGLVIS